MPSRTPEFDRAWLWFIGLLVVVFFIAYVFQGLADLAKWW